MPFLLYEKTGEGDNLDVLEQRGGVTFGGNSKGLLLKYLVHRGTLERARSSVQGSKKPYFDDFLAADLLSFQGHDPDSHRLVIDLKPRAKENVSLYEVRELWVAINETWTPIMLRVHPLFMDEKVEKGREGECKRRILVDPDRDAGYPIHDIIYLSGGYEKGSWNPSRLGQYSAALLFPEVAEHFSRVMLENLDRYGSKTTSLSINRLGCKQD